VECEEGEVDEIQAFQCPVCEVLYETEDEARECCGAEEDVPLFGNVADDEEDVASDKGSDEGAKVEPVADDENDSQFDENDVISEENDGSTLEGFAKAILGKDDILESTVQRIEEKLHEEPETQGPEPQKVYYYDLVKTSSKDWVRYREREGKGSVISDLYLKKTVNPPRSFRVTVEVV
jgi:hypothetical protein